MDVDISSLHELMVCVVRYVCQGSVSIKQLCYVIWYTTSLFVAVIINLLLLSSIFGILSFGF